MTEKKRQPYTRRWAPKRRSGCGTCKVRHTRCDETKPYCNKCVSTGRKCDGYQSAVSTPSPTNRQQAVMHPPQTILYPPSLHQYEPSEHRSFDFFIHKTAPHLCLYFMADFWQKYVPSLSFSQVALRHAIAAIAAIHEGYSEDVEKTSLEYRQQRYSFALQQYSLSIRCLQESLIEGGDETIEPVILCCTLYTCFDSFRGNYNAATTHLRAALRILSEYLERRSRNGAGRSGAIQASIIDALTSIGNQCGLFIDSVLPVESWDLWYHLGRINEGYAQRPIKNIQDARYKLQCMTSSFMLKHVEYQAVAENFPEDAVFQYPDVMVHLGDWSHEFNERMREIALTRTELHASMMLKIHHAAMTVMANDAIFGVRNVTNSELIAPYETIIDLSRALIKASDDSFPIAASISCDVGFLGPLFFTVSHCTVPRVRWEALALLKSLKRREGMWDADVVARVAGKLLSVEEDTAFTGLSKETRPRVQAVRLVSSDNDLVDLTDKLTVDIDFSEMNPRGGEVIRTERAIGRKEIC